MAAHCTSHYRHNSRSGGEEEDSWFCTTPQTPSTSISLRKEVTIENEVRLLNNRTDCATICTLKLNTGQCHHPLIYRHYKVSIFAWKHWFKSLYTTVKSSRRFGEMCYIHLQCELGSEICRQHVAPKRLEISFSTPCKNSERCFCETWNLRPLLHNLT